MAITTPSLSGNISPVNGAYYVQAIHGVDTAGTYINKSDGNFLITTLGTVVIDPMGKR